MTNTKPICPICNGSDTDCDDDPLDPDCVIWNLEYENNKLRAELTDYKSKSFLRLNLDTIGRIMIDLFTAVCAILTVIVGLTLILVSVSIAFKLAKYLCHMIGVL